MKYAPHNYQVKGTAHILDDIVEDTKSRGCFFTVGTGKSVMSLTAVEELFSSMIIDKPLIIGPSRVVSHTWPNEIKKWDHTKYLSISVIQHKSSYRSEQQRIDALNTPADIYAISRDNIAWLVHYCAKTFKRWPFDILIIDELSNYRNPSTQRFKAIRKILPYCRQVIGLTGTPAPSQLLGLWSQVYLLDKGKRLGTTFGAYKDKYFMPGARSGHIVYNYILKKGAEQQIYDAIKDICMSMAAEDYLSLPERTDIYEEIELEDFDKYLEFKRTEVLTMADGFELTPVNAAGLYNLLLQYSNGAIYRHREDGSRYYEVVNTSKLDAICSDVEELQGEPVLIVFQFISDYERLQKAIPQLRKISTDEDIDDWNAKKIEVGCAQINSLAYGINMQDGGHHLFWYSLPWDLELYIQFLGRLHRQGQLKHVINKHYVIKGGIEELIRERLAGKYDTQQKLMEALKRYL